MPGTLRVVSRASRRTSAGLARQSCQRGAAILVVQTDKMKRGVENGKNFKFSDQYGYWGKEFRSMGSNLSMSMISTLVPTLL